MLKGTITTIADLLACLEKDHGAYEGSLWFRGQADVTWKLLPGYLRLVAPPSEGTLLKRFKQSAAMLLDRDPKDTFDWMFLMQHYGLPTRLLDWSESPLVGLYFAVADPSTRDDKDSALWVLRPTELNRHAKIHDANEPYFIPSFDDEELKNYSLESLAQGPKRTRLQPIATIATRNNPRIQAQLGVFTIHHLDGSPIESIADESHIARYEIPAKAKAELRKQLLLLGFSKFTMFPELSSVSDTIKRGLK